MKYDRHEKDTRCKPRESSSMACVDDCCKPHAAPTKPPSIVKCKEWTGHCRRGMDYDHSEAHTRCKPRESSSMACVDECCKDHVVSPSVKPPSIVMCKEWVGTWGGVCRAGSHYDQHMDETRCKGRSSS